MGPCPCWVGDDPDGGHCNSFTGYHINEGHARGVDLSGLSLVSLVQIPGNVAAGNWSEVLFVDANATDEQHDALVDAFQGRLGGPLADLAALITDRRAQYRVPIEYTIEDGVGTVKVARPDNNGYAIDAVMEPYRGPDGEPTRLVNSSGARSRATRHSSARQATTRSRSPSTGWSGPMRAATRSRGSASSSYTRATHDEGGVRPG